jgi:aryl-alcohol dehydrogenase-like predicted oxidoreductase
METRTLGSLWPVSALTLGGAGLGQLWGSTSRDEAAATMREAVESGITLIDVAPRYGDGEAERVVGETFGGRLPDGVRVATKHRVSNPPDSDVYARLGRSLQESLDRMKLAFVDLFLLHGSIVATEAEGGERRTPRRLYAEAVRPAFERLVEEGRIGAWGITAIGVPSVLLEVLGEQPTPGAVQAIANPLDSAGDLGWFQEEARPREIIADARQRGIGVMGIRAVDAGALTDSLDRDPAGRPPHRPRLQPRSPLRDLARELGESTASLAHRYAVAIPGVDTVVLGVKNRDELHDCLAAEARGRLSPEIVQEIDRRLPSRP